MKQSVGLLLSLGSTAFAAVSKTCPTQQSDICYSLNIPDAAASSGSGDIFFQITAPSTLQWIALGQGSQMAGAHIFVMYQSANGMNVTVSPRTGVAHVEPEHDTATQLTLLEGSGIANGTMTANVKCSNCQTWQGGSMNFAASNGQWIFAGKSGNPIQSDDLGEEIMFHDMKGTFEWDFSTAKGGNEANPFLSNAAAPQPTHVSTPASSEEEEVPSNLSQIMIAHGVLATLAFVIIFPTGGILIRLGKFSGTLTAHRVIQMLGYFIYLAAFGLGAYMSSTLKLTGDRHPIIGIVVLVIILFQPLFGMLHHRKFKQVSSRNIWSIAHLSIGRIAIVLGIINGGLGLDLAQNASRGALIAYGVIAGIFGVAYISAIVYGEISRRGQKGSSDTRSDENQGSEVEFGRQEPK